MQKSDNVQTIKVHRQVQPSATLNRKYVKRPAPAAPTHKIQIRTDHIEEREKPVQSSPAISRFGKVDKAPLASKPVVKSSQIAQKPATPKVTAPKVAAPKVVAAKPAVPKVTSEKDSMSPEQLKDLAIKKALRSAAKEEDSPRPHKIHFSLGRVFLAFACTVAAIFALVYFVNLNVFNLSVVNAAKEAGLETSNTPKVPNGFELSDIASEDGKLTLTYFNNTTKASFVITEERSSWDSNALLTNYVKPTFGDDYSIVREQGLTIYINDSNATWVNGRIVYKIIADNGAITKKQIRTIATSL